MTREEAAIWLEAKAKAERIGTAGVTFEPQVTAAIDRAEHYEAAAALLRAPDTLTLSMAYDQGREDEKAKAVAHSRELAEALEDMVRQHCPTDVIGRYDSCALSANADAMRLLAKAGRCEIKAEHGRRVFVRFKVASPAVGG